MSLEGVPLNTNPPNSQPGGNRQSGAASPATACDSASPIASQATSPAARLPLHTSSWR